MTGKLIEFDPSPRIPPPRQLRCPMVASIPLHRYIIPSRENKILSLIISSLSLDITETWLERNKSTEAAFLVVSTEGPLVWKVRVSRARDADFGREVEQELLQERVMDRTRKDSGALFRPGVEAVNEGIIIIGRRDCETAVQERVEFTQELATIRR